MFKSGDYVVYGSRGVCQVEGVGTLSTPGVTKGRIYYTLRPYYQNGTTIFTPADGNKVIMRPVTAREEAMELIEDMNQIETLWIGDEKKREQQYKEAMRQCSIREQVKIIKTIYERKQMRIAEGKKVTVVDEKYFHLAEDGLYGELAISLGLTRDEAKKHVVSRVTQIAEERA